MPRLTESYIEQVLLVVEQIPPGQVTTYGDLAAYVGDRRSARLVGVVMSRHGAGVPWWRVVRASGHPAAGLEPPALDRLAAEGVPMVGDRVDLHRARWAG